MSTISASTTSTTALVATADTTGTLTFQTGSGPTTAMYVDGSQNVGIGTSSPTSFGAGYTVLDVYNGTTGGYILARSPNVTGQVAVDNNTAFYVQTRTNHPILFVVNNAEKMRIDTSGNLIVGQTSATINGSYTGTLGSVSTTTTKTALAVGATSGSYTGQIIQTSSISTGSTSWAHAYGAYGNGSSITTDAYYIYGNGNITNHNNSYGGISDIKLKENIVDATPKLADVMKLQVRNFNFKSDPTIKQIGFVAQEFEQVFPSIVEASPDRDAEGKDLGTSTKSIKTSVLIPILVKAIQEQQAIITQLQTDIAALKAKVGA